MRENNYSSVLSQMRTLFEYQCAALDRTAGTRWHRSFAEGEHEPLHLSTPNGRLCILHEVVQKNIHPLLQWHCCTNSHVLGPQNSLHYSANLSNDLGIIGKLSLHLPSENSSPTSPTSRPAVVGMLQEHTAMSSALATRDSVHLICTENAGGRAHSS